MIPFEGVKEAISALGFWSALASGYHQDLQLFMGSAQSGANLFPELAELLHLTVKVLMVCSNDAVLALFHEILVVMEALIEGPCQPNQQQLASSVAVQELGRLLYRIDSISSEHMPYFVDELREQPQGTFEPAFGISHLDQSQILLIKKGIYSLFKAMVDGSEPSVTRSLLPHINVLCLLRDMFTV